jgi:hypothetical protein
LITSVLQDLLVKLVQLHQRSVHQVSLLKALDNRLAQHVLQAAIALKEALKLLVLLVTTVQVTTTKCNVHLELLMPVPEALYCLTVVHVLQAKPVHQQD